MKPLMQEEAGVVAEQAPKLSRRALFQHCARLGAGLPLAALALRCDATEATAPALPAPRGPARHNFQAVYEDPAQRAAFRDFLTEVFHLYPETAFDKLIAAHASTQASDLEVFHAVAAELPQIRPWLASLRYALPALRKQKAEMRRQSLRLLGNRQRFEGYVEIGSAGRYLSALREGLEIEGPIWTSTAQAPGYDPEALIDREQLSLVGSHVPLADYAPLAVPPGSAELMTVFIGLHHCPLTKREAYVEALRDALAPGGLLVLRDHDVRSTELNALVALAHDVFNLGTGESWAYNAAELRHFYPLAYIVDFLEARGFRASPGRLRQAGDPTHNTLMLFTKV